MLDNNASFWPTTCQNCRQLDEPPVSETKESRRNVIELEKTQIFQYDWIISNLALFFRPLCLLGLGLGFRFGIGQPRDYRSLVVVTSRSKIVFPSFKVLEN